MLIVSVVVDPAHREYLLDLFMLLYTSRFVPLTTRHTARLARLLPPPNPLRGLYH